MEERARSRTIRPRPDATDRTVATGQGSSTTAGMLAARTWLTARSLTAPTLTRWHATVSLGITDQRPTVELDERVDTRFRIEIYSEEWGYFFCHGGRASWIRVTDIPFVHGRDDFQLLAATPALKDLGQLLRRVEKQHGLRFRRDHALVRTNLAHAELEIRRWVLSL